MTIMKVRRSIAWFLGIAATLTLAKEPHGQGRTSYLNFEAPVVEPIVVATVGSSTFLLVCNTPDNSVEVYSLANPNQPAFVDRIPVGLEPVSLAFRTFSNGASMLYTANWLGDSVSYVQLFSDVSDPFSYQFIGSFSVAAAYLDDASPADPALQGDEPVYVYPQEVTINGFTARILLVAKRSQSSFAQLDALTGAPYQGNAANLDVIVTNAGAFNVSNRGSLSGSMALKAPQAIAMDSQNRIVVLAHHGGAPKPSPVQPAGVYDFDLWFWKSTPPTSITTIGGLGTTHFNMAFAGTDLFVLGTRANNERLGNEEVVGPAKDREIATTMLYRVSTSGTPIQTGSLELNAGIANRATQSVAQATDLDVYVDPATSNTYLCIVGFNSDRLAIVNAATMTVVSRFTILKLSTIADNIAGPRGVAVYDSASRAYTLNTIDNSISVVNISNVNNPTLILQGTAPLQKRALGLNRVPMSGYIKNGRSFLYGAKYGNHLNSCASCHIDGRTDQLVWRLTPEKDTIAFETTAAGDPLSIATDDRFGFDFDTVASQNLANPLAASVTLYENLTHALATPEGPLPGFPDEDQAPAGLDPALIDNAKGPMVTQSLQGLVNSEVFADGDLEHRFSNAPYHWRGDKKTFRDFNEAFEGLLGGVQLTSAQMDKFESFINSIHYPPNSSQKLDRSYSGGPGVGAQAGVRGYHEVRHSEFGTRSCVNCHSLPAGSDNRWTFVRLRDNIDPLLAGDALAPINTPILRGLRHKEARLELTTNPVPGLNLVCGNFGTGSAGNRGLSMNAFEQPLSLSDDAKQRIIAYLREFDTGVAPVVGRSVSVFPNEVDSVTADWSAAFLSGGSTRPAQLEVLQEQASIGNAGLVAWFFDNGVLASGYFYWATDNLYHQVGTPGSTFAISGDSNELFELLVDEPAGTGDSLDRLLFLSVPLGSELRIASQAATQTIGGPGAGFDATGLSMIGTTPITCNAIIVPNDDDNIGALTLNPDPVVAVNFTPEFAEPIRLIALRSLRTVCADPSLALEVPAGRNHDAPRRLQFAGGPLETLVTTPGGKIKFGIPLDNAGAFEFVTLPIYPTSKETDGGLTVWETGAEFETMLVYMLLLGGPHAPGVDSALKGISVTATDFAPGTWNNNSYRMTLVHPNGSESLPVQTTFRYPRVE